MATTQWHAVGGLAGSVWLWRKVKQRGWGLNTVAVRLSGDELMLISPTRGLPEEAHVALAELGNVRYLLAPNHFHNMGLEEYLVRYRNAQAIAGAGALPRLRKRLPITVAPLSALPALPPGVRLIEPPGLASGEVWVEVASAAERLWIVGDALMSEPDRAAGMLGTILRLTRTAPGLCIGSTFRWLAVADLPAYRGWLVDALSTQRPTAVVPMHGAVLRDPRLPERLLELVAERLG